MAKEMTVSDVRSRIKKLLEKLEEEGVSEEVLQEALIEVTESFTGYTVTPPENMEEDEE